MQIYAIIIFYKAVEGGFFLGSVKRPYVQLRIWKTL